MNILHEFRCRRILPARRNNKHNGTWWWNPPQVPSPIKPTVLNTFHHLMPQISLVWLTIPHGSWIPQLITFSEGHLGERYCAFVKTLANCLALKPKNIPRAADWLTSHVYKWINHVNKIPQRNNFWTLLHLDFKSVLCIRTCVHCTINQWWLFNFK